MDKRRKTQDGAEPSENAKRLFILYKQGLIDIKTAKEAIKRYHSK